MAFIYTDRIGTKRCPGCGKKKIRNSKSNNSTGLCDACLSLENAKAKSKHGKK